MAWEWRYFVQTSLPDDGSMPLQGKREDVYFPAGDDVGLKLRNGEGSLEAKVRLECSDANGRLPGHAEKWDKTIHRRCIAKTGRDPQVDAASCVRALGRSADMLFAEGAGHPLPVRVFCRKSRRYTRWGEEVDCLFYAVLDDHSGRHSIMERYRSVSVEGGSPMSIAAIVEKMGAVPENAILAGYPKIVQDIAQRALKANQATLQAGFSLAGIPQNPYISEEKLPPIPGTPPCALEVSSQLEKELESPPTDEVLGVLVRQQYRVLAAGDVRSLPSSDAPGLGRLEPGSLVQGTREINVEGRVWVLVCRMGGAEETIGWTSLTKKNGSRKLESAHGGYPMLGVA